MRTTIITLGLFVIFIASFVKAESVVLHKVLLKNTEALCLDGSPGAYYFAKGSAPEKILLFFEGGGWCGNKDLASTIESCHNRGKGDLGSSKHYPDSLTQTDGILSNNANNPFREYTKVFLKYCDGTGHQGFKAAPISYKGENVYFRGHKITQGVFEQIEKSDGLFSKATDIIVSGTSAGGLAAFIWADYVREKAKAKNVHAAPDSGIFLNSANFHSRNHQFVQRFVNFYKLSNAEIAPPVPQCIKANQAQPYKCFFVEQLYKYIKTPLFVIESLYDSYSIPNILGILCTNGTTSLKNCSQSQLNYIEQYHKNTSALIQKIGSIGHNGYWAIACAHHTFIKGGNFQSPSFRVPQNTNGSIAATMHNWITNAADYKRMDQNPWPSNKPCSGVNNLQLNPESIQ